MICKGDNCQVIVKHPDIRCPSCMKKHTEFRKYQRRHEHRKKKLTKK